MTNSALQNTGLWEEPEKATENRKRLLWEEPKKATEKSALKKLGITLPKKKKQDIAETAFTRLGISRKRQRQLSRLPGRKRRKGAGIILE